MSDVPPTASDVPPAPSASIVIPTVGRLEYLGVALASVAPQAKALGAEMVVVNDGGDPRTAATASRHQARTVSLRIPSGVNGARNAGIKAALSDLVILLDDDVEVSPRWLEAMLTGVRSSPHHEVFSG